jgi:cell division protein ZapA
MSSNQLRVNIFGSEYVLRANDDDRETMLEIANYVDQKMREIDRSQAINSNLKVAILAALNITEELIESRKYRDKLLEQLNEESRKLNRSLEEALDL